MKFNFKLEDIKYIKILYKNDSGTPAVMKCALKKIDEREILACGKFQEEFIVPLPQEITLSVICNDGLYRTKTILKTVENADPYFIFVLETPQGIEYEQNREFFRVPAKYTCTYKVLENNDYKEYKAETIDISANGVSILISSHVISEYSSDLSILINGRFITPKVTYVRSEKQPEGYKISFKYSEISNSDRDYISQICLQKQLEARRRAIK